MFLGFSSNSFGQSGNLQNLRIRVSNIQSVKGNILIAVYNSSQKFPGNEMVTGKIERVTRSGEMTIIVEEVPFGQYAVSIFHDENSNKTLDSNFLKIPTEPYGFSNNARGRFGPPDFEDARINFNSNQQVFEIRLK